jgi:hypothetical protein
VGKPGKLGRGALGRHRNNDRDNLGLLERAAKSRSEAHASQVIVGQGDAGDVRYDDGQK